MVSLHSDEKKSSSSIKYLVWLLVFLVLMIALVSGLYFFKTEKMPWQGLKISTQVERTSSGLIVGGEYVVLESIYAYVSSDDSLPAGYIIPGKYFQVLEQNDEMVHVEMIGAENVQAANGWIKFSETSYKLAEKE